MLSVAYRRPHALSAGRKGQFYGVHHDLVPAPEEFSGPRMLTFFVYLNDVKSGGGTNFPFVQGDESKNPQGVRGLTVTPKRGSAILWANSRNAELTKELQETHHQALPVLRGQKLAANIWIHQRNRQAPQLWNCAVRCWHLPCPPPPYRPCMNVNSACMLPGDSDAP